VTFCWRGIALVAALVAVVGGCSEIGIPVETPAQPSGVRGTVLLGPTCPVESTPGANDPVPCLTPYSANLVIIDSEGIRVDSVTSGSDGTFQVDLEPGDYVVTPATGADTYPIAQPVSVTVSPGQYASVEINYDTGIR
jgi:hypothetical protein